MEHIILYIILSVVGILGLWFIVIYNKFISNKELVGEAWSGIDVQLKRRSNLLPNLLETVKAYIKHEKDVITEVTELRSSTQQCKPEDVIERGKVEHKLTSALGRLFALAENYPELKANTTFLDLQQNLSQIESEISMARRYYNGTARTLNTLVGSFPSNLIAKIFSFSKVEYFEDITEAERAVPKMDFNQK